MKFLLNDNPPLNFKPINPIDTEYHNVVSRITTLSINAIDTLIPSKVKRPTKEPSVIPSPPGINVMTPIITDEVYIEIVFKKLTPSMPNANSVT